MNSSRTSKGIKNILFSMTSRLIIIVLQLASRFVFIKMLPAEYLGLSGLFTNILSFLTLSELGIGTAISFALYKPLAQNDTDKIKSLMALFKKFYIAIGTFILLAGIALTPFLKYFVLDLPSDMKYFYSSYILYVLDAGLGYFFTYKVTLLNSDQKVYISATCEMVCFIVTKILQIIILLFTQNYLIYLSVQVILALLEKVIVVHIVNKKYPYLSLNDAEELTVSEKADIKQNVLALLFQKIGDVIVNATDNIIITKVLGLIIEGIYSNYYLITSNINILALSIINALVGSVGNFVAEKDTAEQRKFFNDLLFANFWIYLNCSVCIFVLSEPFIALFFGKTYVLGSYTMWAVAGCFYLTGIRRSVGIYKEVTGLFWNDRYRSLTEAAVNLISSIVLAKLFGVAGVKLGTIIGILCVSFWWEPYALFKHHFNDKLSSYLKTQFGYMLFTVCCFGLCGFLASFIPISLTGLVLMGIMCIVVTNALFIMIYSCCSEFKYFKSIGNSIAKKIIKK